LTLAAPPRRAHLEGVHLRAIAELVGLVRPSGNDLPLGLEHDLGRVTTRFVGAVQVLVGRFVDPAVGG
jgi:hypothetical protein